jgi:hypothetical protein
MFAAAASVVVDRIVAVENGHVVTMTCPQGPQSLLIGDAHVVIHIGPALKNAEQQGRPNGWRLNLTVEEGCEILS